MRVSWRKLATPDELKELAAIAQARHDLAKQVAYITANCKERFKRQGIPVRGVRSLEEIRKDA